MHRGGIVFVFLVAAIVASAAAPAQDWQRLTDGRVVIDIKGRKFAFPTTGSELNDITFYASIPGSSHVSLKLKQVIDSPAMAGKIFSDKKLVLVSIPNPPERDGLFLGRFNRNQFGRIDSSILLGETAQGNCRAWERIHDKHRKQMNSEPALVQADGWAEFIDERSPKTWMYVRQTDLPGLPKYFDSFSCEFFGLCSSSSCVGSNASFSYQFKRDARNRESWNSVIQKASDVFRYFFIDKIGEVDDAR